MSTSRKQRRQHAGWTGRDAQAVERSCYRRVLMPVGAAAIIVVAAYWFVIRALGVPVAASS